MFYNFHSRNSLGTLSVKDFCYGYPLQEIFIMQIVHSDTFCYWMLVFIKAIIHCVLSKSPKKGMGWFLRDLRTCQFSFIRPPPEIYLSSTISYKNNCLEVWETCEMLVMWHKLLIVLHWHRCAYLVIDKFYNFSWSINIISCNVETS